MSGERNVTPRLQHAPHGILSISACYFIFTVPFLLFTKELEQQVLVARKNFFKFKEPIFQMSLLAKLKELNEAYEAKIISQDEYDRSKDTLLKAFASGAPSGSSVVPSDASVLQSYFQKRDDSEYQTWLKDERQAIIKRDRAVEPWKIDEKKARHMLRVQHGQLAKSEKIPPTESLILTYLLEGETCSAEAVYFCAYLLLMIPAQQRLSVHNWNVAQTMPKTEKESYGDAISRLSFPLFPTVTGHPGDDVFKGLNFDLLRAVEKEIAGAGTNCEGKMPAGHSMFDRASFFGEDVAGAGYYTIPVQQSPNGSIVDVSVIHDAVFEIRQELQNLRNTRQNSAGRNQVGQGPRGNGNGRGGNGRGGNGRGGHGKHRWHQPQGGDAEDTNNDANTTQAGSPKVDAIGRPHIAPQPATAPNRAPAKGPGKALPPRF
jgi:hypothetical protein